jgi:hypothetical protein
MSDQSSDPRPASGEDTSAAPGTPTCCGSGCACHGGTGWRRFLPGAIILILAAVLIVRAATKPRAAPSHDSSAVAMVCSTAASPTVAASGGPAAVPEAVVGTEIGAFAELQTLARDLSASFVFMPPRATEGFTSPAAALEAAVQTLSGRGQKVGLFTLRVDCPDYTRVVAKTPPPAVLTMVKEGGMQAVTEPITEAKLIQAFVAASGSSGGCGASGCAPGSPGCK